MPSNRPIESVPPDMMPFKPLASGLLCLLLLPASSPAQEGDKTGVVQTARVPKEKIPPAPPLAPADAQQSFKLPPGFRIELFACEPMIESPVVLQFDPDGRLWVVEMRGFMPDADGRGEDQPAGRISILADTDGDGRADRKTVFLDRLVMPRALLLVHGGALVCEPPRLWFYPIQVDRPGERVLVADDFARDADPKHGPRTNPEHSGNSLLRNLDNWIYSLHHPWRYRFAGGRWQREPTPQRVQWGLAQDDFGRLFYTSNSDHLRGDLVPSHYFPDAARKARLPGIGVPIARDQSVWPARMNPGVNRGYESGTLRADGTLARFTAACGTCVYRGDLFPGEYYGNAFVCEPAANVVRRSLLSEQDGVITARNAHDKTEFLTSTDELFRPVNLATGPDGALYIADMYRGIIQHRMFLTTYLRQQAADRGLDRVIDKGRIWRVVATGRTSAAGRPHLTARSSADLAQTLAHPNGWWRDTAQRLLVERADPAIVPALEKLASTAPNPVTRLHALWTLAGMNQLRPPAIEAALADPHPKVRAAGVRLAEPVPGQPAVAAEACAALRAKVLERLSDPSADVQIQLALSLGLIGGADRGLASNALVTLATNAVPLVRELAAFASATPDPAKSEAPAAKAVPLTPEQQRRFEAGQALYEATCLACHQVHGLGQPGLAPPLAGSEWLAGSEERLIRIVLHGLRGPIKVKGESYEMDMPSLGVLDDDQIAAVLTYVRREWGHTFPPVEPGTVKQVRQKTETREDAWTMAELLRIP